MKTIKAKKSLGQNFLTDTRVVQQILDVATVGEGDRIFEIGPGTGALTGPLIDRGAEVTAAELDHELVKRLTKNFQKSDRFSILEGNILDMDMDALLVQSGFADRGYKVVANIPYYITAPIIRMLLSLRARPERIVLMVQEEVADRLSAPAGKMSLLSLLAQYYASVRKELRVPRESFEPVPKVDSAVISLLPYRPYDEAQDRRIFRLARAGFAARRKTLANNLSSSLRLPRKEVETVLADMELDTRIRAQELSVEEWITLADRMEVLEAISSAR
jgi:16S rRNA (adenine1518-N6/adenine1519-N6)-dimethyltransferase